MEGVGGRGEGEKWEGEKETRLGVVAAEGKKAGVVEGETPREEGVGEVGGGRVTWGAVGEA